MAEAELAQAQAYIEDLQVQKEELQQQIKKLRGAFSTTSAAPTVVVNGHAMDELIFEEGILLLVVGFMMMLWTIPFLRPFRHCCQTRLHKVFPVITVVNLLVLAVTLNQLILISFNDMFFGTVKLFEEFLEKIDQVLMGCAALFGFAVVWKFKDRVFEVLGVENAFALIGEPRDWATCWSMKRFHPLEVFIWKVEGLPSARLHSPNDVFCEVSFGYNVVMKTRVHHGAGHSCTFKETLQLNFDPFDSERRLTLSIKSQEVVGASELAKLQLGAEQVRRLEESSAGVDRAVGWGSTANPAVWASDNFKALDLVPAGKVYLRFVPVLEDSRSCWESFWRTR